MMLRAAMNRDGGGACPGCSSFWQRNMELGRWNNLDQRLSKGWFSCFSIVLAYLSNFGVVLVKYKDSKNAHKCIELMNQQWFGGKQSKHRRWIS
ncbi:hypothetical protein CASFOL_029543 [Castilleja foliolosa]|uniref:RRM domain-containing protein n=1 Tax=Castilleja foliolosa TaxID=1961234 RepID=A0ABD3C8T0_9LAMI